MTDMKWRKLRGLTGYKTEVLELPEGTTKIQHKPLGRNLGYGWVATFPDGRTFTADTIEAAKEGAENHLQRERDEATGKRLAQQNSEDHILIDVIAAWEKLHNAISIVQTSLPDRLSASMQALEAARRDMRNAMNQWTIRRAKAS